MYNNYIIKKNGFDSETKTKYNMMFCINIINKTFLKDLRSSVIYLLSALATQEYHVRTKSANYF
jgi:hypothetical protein